MLFWTRIIIIFSGMKKKKLKMYMYISLSQLADRKSFIVGGGDEFSISLGVLVYILYIRNIVFSL